MAQSDRAENSTSEDGFEERRAKAVCRCAEQIRFFEGAARKAHVLYAMSQIITIVLSGLTPVILLGGLPEPLDLGDESAKATAAVFAATVAIATGLSGAFRWHEAWTRYAFFVQALTSERNMFETRTAIYAGPRERALNLFVQRTEDLRMAEATEWRDIERALADPSRPDASGPSDPAAEAV